MISSEELLRHAATFHQAGRYVEAEELYLSILRVQPKHLDANHNLGLLAMQQGQAERGLAYLQTAWEADPSVGQYWLTLIECLLALGQFEDALRLVKEAIKRGMKTPQTQHLQLLAKRGQDRTPPPGAVVDEILKLFRVGSNAELEQRVLPLLEQYPGWVLGWSSLGAALHLQNKDAEHALRRAAQLAPHDAEAQNNLGVFLKHNEGVEYLQAAIRLRPKFAEAHFNLGSALAKLRRFDKALESLQRAVQLRPAYAEAHQNIGAVLEGLHRLEEAVASYRRALEIKPDFAEAHSNLGNALKELGRLDDAVASYRRALEIKPDHAVARSNLLFLYGYHALLNPAEYLAQARDWELSCVPAQDRQAACHRFFQHPPLTGRRLKVGYVSGDFRQHAVSYFIEQLFTYHDKARIELFAYSNNAELDAVTERLQALVDHWVSVADISDVAAMERIEADGIDVLIDLSGHTSHNRLGVFARRAAPVQAHYLGFMASTGLTEMDYWIGDKTLTPAETDSHFSEQVWRLPRVWVSYQGKADAPLQNWQPSRDGAIWLGSFNNLGKLTPATLALWAKVLHALPEGRLLLKTKALADAGNRQRILEVFSEHGISQDRIELQDINATPDWTAHMAYYDRLDIALDPVGGVGGGTTTCDALWMGAPVITLEGDRMASRMTASMLDAIGQPEWIACLEAEYIDKVVTLARDVEQRKTLRSGQRMRMASSPLCDAKGLAACLENAYLEMFTRSCSGRSK